MPPINTRNITTRNQPSTSGFKFGLTIEWWTRPPVLTRLLELVEMALMNVVQRPRPAEPRRVSERAGPADEE